MLYQGFYFYICNGDILGGENRILKLYLTYTLPQNKSIGTYNNTTWHKNQIVCNAEKKGEKKQNRNTLRVKIKELKLILTQRQVQMYLEQNSHSVPKEWNTQTFSYNTISIQHSTFFMHRYTLTFPNYPRS